MSHPFTIEYMSEGDTFSTEIYVRGTRKQDNQHESLADNGQQINPRPNSGIFERNSVTDEGHTNPDEENLEAIEQIKEEMNIAITDNERVSFLKILAMGMRRQMKIFAEEATIVGLSYLVKPSIHKIGSIIRKIMWTMLLLFGVGFMVFQIYDRITYYLTYPTIVDYRVAYNRTLRFPTVTICPEFIISKKGLLSLGPQMQSFASIRYPPAWYMGLDNDNRTLNFPQMDLDWQFVYNVMVVKTEDWMLECTFGNLPCQSSYAIKQITTSWGFCLSFNPVTANYMTTQPGANYGLRLVLWVNQSDCYMTMSPAVGFKVLLHDPHDQPYAQDLGFRVGTGVSTSVSFSLRNLSMLPSPYGDCRNEENYTYDKCMMQCADNYIFSICKCLPNQMEVSGKIICSFDQYYSCVSKVVRWGFLRAHIARVIVLFSAI